MTDVNKPFTLSQAKQNTIQDQSDIQAQAKHEAIP